MIVLYDETLWKCCRFGAFISWEESDKQDLKVNIAFTHSNVRSRTHTLLCTGSNIKKKINNKQRLPYMQSSMSTLQSVRHCQTSLVQRFLAALRHYDSIIKWQLQWWITHCSILCGLIFIPYSLYNKVHSKEQSRTAGYWKKMILRYVCFLWYTLCYF